MKLRHNAAPNRARLVKQLLIVGADEYGPQATKICPKMAELFLNYAYL
jgi:hypothetical protein